MKTKKKRNPNDATLRNIRALKKRVAVLEAKVRKLIQDRSVTSWRDRGMKLEDEQGNEFEFREQWGTSIGRFGYLCPWNPLPELEEGDWYLSNGCLFRWLNDYIDIRDRTNWEITEIRKANGTVWKRG